VKPSTTIRRRVEWMDTDAAGIWHYSTVIRLAEAAEADLHGRLGIKQVTFGATPRAHIEFDFESPLEFDDEVDVTLSVAALGTSSITYDVAVAGPAGPVATGRIVTVFIDGETKRPAPLPDDVRRALEGT